MPKVKFTSALKRFYPDLKELNTQSRTVGETLYEIDEHFPGISDYLVNEKGELREHVNIYIGKDLIKDRKGLTDPLNEMDEIFVFQAISGG